MLPSVPPARPDASSATAYVDACRDVDKFLFEPDQWFAIDSANHKVAGVAPGTLDQALALVGRGQVATIVGRLRPQVVAVDVDAAGADAAPAGGTAAVRRRTAGAAAAAGRTRGGAVGASSRTKATCMRCGMAALAPRPAPRPQ